MPTQSRPSRWKKILGYLAFSIFSFYIGFAFTFPYDALMKFLQYEAGKAGYELTIKSIWMDFALRARGIALKPKSTDESPLAASPLRINSFSIRPQLFPLGLRASSQFWDGDLDVSVSPFSSLKLSANISDVNLAHPNVKDFLGAELTGKWDGEFELTAPLVKMGTQGSMADWSSSNGYLDLTSKSLATKGGSIMSIDLPKANLGDLTAKISVVKGVATLSAFELKGEGVEMKTTGTVKLAQRAANSELNVELRVKVTKEFSTALGPYAFALSQLREVPNERDWRYLKITGLLSNNPFLAGMTGR